MTSEALLSAVADMRHGNDAVVPSILAHFESQIFAAVQRLRPVVHHDLQASVDAEIEDRVRLLLHHLVYSQPAAKGGGGSLRQRAEPVANPDAWISRSLNFAYKKLIEERCWRAAGRKRATARDLPTVITASDERVFVRRALKITDIAMPENDDAIKHERELCRAELLAMQDTMLERALRWGNSFERSVMGLALFTTDPEVIRLAMDKPGITNGQIIEALKRLFYDSPTTGHRISA